MTPEQLDQMRRDADTLRSTNRSGNATDRVEAFERLYKALPQLVDELTRKTRELARHDQLLRASIIEDLKHYFASVDDSLYDDVLTLCGRIERGEYGRVSG